MATSSILSNTPLEPEHSKGAWHTFLLDHRDAFANLVRYLVVDEALVKYAISRALVRIERMPFESSDPLLIYKQARRAVIREAVAVLKEPLDCPTVYTVGPAGDLSESAKWA
jgi:hypothetical protein